MSKKIFVTGATGLLGSRLVASLLVEGYEITCSKRGTSDMSLCSSIQSQVKWVDLDILDQNLLTENVIDFDWVVHAAAVVSFDPKDTQQIDEVNHIGTRNMVNVCLENKIPNLFYVSSVAALGRTEENKPIDEESKWEDSALNSVYAVSKYLAELEVWRGEQEGLNVSIINPSVILGPGDIDKSSTKLFQFVRKYKFIYPEGFVNIVDVRDVAKVAVKLIKKEVFGERFIVNACMLTYKELLSEMANCFKLKPPTVCFSKSMAWFFYPVFQVLAFITRKPSFLTKQSIKLMDLKSEYDTSKLKKELTFEYEEWQDTVKWSCNELTK